MVTDGRGKMLISLRKLELNCSDSQQNQFPRNNHYSRIFASRLTTLKISSNSRQRSGSTLIQKVITCVSKSLVGTEQAQRDFFQYLISIITNHDVFHHNFNSPNHTAGQQRGPVISRMIMHKWHEGDIDGLTLVYSSLIGEWKKVSEVDVLKEAISKVAQEEQAGEIET